MNLKLFLIIALFAACSNNEKQKSLAIDSTKTKIQVNITSITDSSSFNVNEVPADSLFSYFNSLPKFEIKSSLSTIKRNPIDVLKFKLVNEEYILLSKDKNIEYYIKGQSIGFTWNGQYKFTFIKNTQGDVFTYISLKDDMGNYLDNNIIIFKKKSNDLKWINVTAQVAKIQQKEFCSDILENSTEITGLFLYEFKKDGFTIFVNNGYYQNIDSSTVAQSNFKFIDKTKLDKTFFINYQEIK
jgi:hypothetical protein